MGSIVLASSSHARRTLLTNAGLTFTSTAARIDERMIEAEMPVGVSPEAVALELARCKALEVAARSGEALVIGCDQTMSLDGELFHKAPDMEVARHQLLRLSGRIHRLNSAVVLARGDAVLWQHVSVAELECRSFTPAFVDSYLERVGEAVLSSVGGYQLEGIGIQLFTRISGDYFTILGLPLLPLLEQLRAMGEIDG